MLHLHALGVALAFLPAASTRRGARFELRANEAPVGLGLPEQDTPGCLAYVGAVEIQPDAANQVSKMFTLGQTGIGARRACLRAVEASFDALP